MKCPECGEENPQGAKYCSKCLTNLVIGAGGYPVPQQSAPSEWRGVPAVHRQDLTRKVQDSSRHLKIEWAVYGGIILVLAIVLLLSVTIWGNKSPTEIAEGFMQALNAKDAEAMRQYVYTPQGGGDDAKIYVLLGRIGSEGSATVNLNGGTYSPGGTGLEVQIDESRKLYIGLENREGRWYVDLTRVNIFP
jgi:uncharacterized membrane protein YvbJ